jgi:uncharacterized protein (TIGR00297 family)
MGDRTGPAALTREEAARKLVHVAAGGLAALLRFMTWPEAALMCLAALLFNWQVLPRLGGRVLWRAFELEKGHPPGILYYPASVLALVLVFRDELWIVAAVWGVLAAGDGMASLVGQAAGGPRLPWNPGKSWAGFAAFVLFGAAAASTLAAWTLRLPLESASSAWILALTVPLALGCALVESAPTALDDNLTVPIAGGVLLALLTRLDLRVLAGDAALHERLLLGLGASAVFAGLARMARAVDTAGALSAALVGAAVTGGLGFAGLAVMGAFFVTGTAATRLGYADKASRGIAQERGGLRGARSVWANGGVPALLALAAAAAAWPLPWIAAYAAGVASAAADTGSSEVGKAWGRRTFLLPSLRRVAAGTEGGVSVAGTLGGLVCAAVVTATGAAAGLYEWTLAAPLALAGLSGSVAESLVGPAVARRGWMGDDLLNAFNTAVGAALGVSIVRAAA